jgi:glucuronate isomerase
MARRLDAGHLARLVVEHQLDEDEAHDVIVDLVSGRPREVFGL